MTARHTLFFNQIDRDDIPLVGGKGANLGEMTKAKFPVPYGFAVTVKAWDLFLKENNIKEEIHAVLKLTDVNNADELQNASRKIERIIINSPVPKEVVDEVFASYKKLSGRFSKALVAVRSSATAEDLPGASFAGQQATYLNIKGNSNLMVAIRDCWASLFTARAIFYREQNKISHDKVKISVIVQNMVQSDVSGVMFSIDPVTNEKDRVIIEAVWGLGELIVQGSVLPDRYVVQKDTFAILSKEVSAQTIRMIKKDNKTINEKVPKKLLDLQKINNEDIVSLAKIATRLQDHYYFPQDIEWAKDKKGDLYITQTRPVTTIKQNEKTANKKETKSTDIPILTGSAASPGIGTGHVKILKSASELSKVTRGDVLVAEMTSPDYVPAMKKASAIITDKGGMTSHAAIVSRELGIPCVVGTVSATKLLKEDQVVSVDGRRGFVFSGTIKGEKILTTKVKTIKSKTATKLYVNLAEVDLATKVAKQNVEGVGLLRAEFMIAGIGIHPKEAIKQKKQEKFIQQLASDLGVFCKAFGNRPVVYRATDFKTNEYRSLPGGKYWEPEESNPMLGYRGAFRYIASPEVFNLELQAIKRVREKHNNLWLEIPFVRSPEELTKVKRIVSAEGLFDMPSFKFWMMVELPINVIMIRDFLKVGVDGVSFGSNDLTMLLTGTDRDNSEVAPAFDERSKAMYWSIRRVIKACNEFGVTSSICGQAPSVFEDMVRELVRMGITSISVNPDAINRVREIIRATEKEIIT